jgi:UPF0755 protein
MKKIAIRMSIVIVLGIIVLTFVYNQSLKPVPSGGVVDLTIPPGSTTKMIAAQLEKQGLIRSANAFTFHAKLSGKGSQLQAGDYHFNKGETVDQILGQLSKGQVSTIQFTVPEGLSVPQLADLLSSKGLIDKNRFLSEVNTGQFDYDFVKAIPKDKDIPYRLEGYLFPKTYTMKKGSSEHEIIDRMLKQFQDEFIPEWTPVMRTERITLHQAVTIASIIEREVRVDSERPIVAGVYFNRLKMGMPLQADATVQFALGKQKSILTLKDLTLNSPFNTYKHKGLPPGPIASPGLPSLESVIKPDKNDFLYYVTKKDGTHEHYFSATYQQHLYYIALSKENNKKEK